MSDETIGFIVGFILFLTAGSLIMGLIGGGTEWIQTGVALIILDIILFAYWVKRGE